MNSQEHEQLNQLLKQLCEVRLTAKDADAEAMIREASARQPDATYLLVQRALLLEQALNNAKARIDSLQNQLQSSQTETKAGFLENNPWSQPPASNSGAVPGISNYQMPRNAPPAQPQAGTGFLSGGGSSFLGNLATTAAGVVAGSFLFHGIENLMDGHSYGSGQQGLDALNSEPTIINNYFEENADQQASSDNDNDFLADNDDDDYQDDDSFSDDSGWA